MGRARPSGPAAACFSSPRLLCAVLLLALSRLSPSPLAPAPVRLASAAQPVTMSSDDEQGDAYVLLASPPPACARACSTRASALLAATMAWRVAVGLLASHTRAALARLGCPRCAACHLRHLAQYGPRAAGPPAPPAALSAVRSGGAVPRTHSRAALRSSLCEIAKGGKRALANYSPRGSVLGSQPLQGERQGRYQHAPADGPGRRELGQVQGCSARQH